MPGFFRNAGQFLSNTGKSIADIGLSTFGADNVIQDSDYKGYGATDFRNIAETGGKITSTIAPIAGAVVAGPAGAMAVKGAQQLGEGFNPEAEGMQQPVAPVQPYYNGMNAIPQMTYAQNYAWGGYVRKPMGYADGGTVQDGFDITSWTDEYRGQPLPQNYNGISPFGQGQDFGIPQGTQYATNYSQPWGTQTPVINNTAANKSNRLNPYIAGGTLALGGFQTLLGYRGLNRLSKEAMPGYSASPQLTAASNRAQEASQRGYTPEQEAEFKNNLAINQNTAYKNAIAQSGGNLAQAINAGLQSQNINALNQFAADDSAKRQQNIQYADSFAPRFQNIQDENTRNALNYRMMREQALGNAVSQGQTNLATGLNAGLASIYKG